ncbi:glucuronate isomerase [Roseibium sp. TrichSKD4]|uniref:glucuronate isomerase n=1 Tax=Roseibium sp. TrichSKD4 TaxID=744980 RepID=UPI0001E56E8B|nr:glucuronate isomerase [Roseibium sp. TrichSKD4]EFO32034.1 glucuronate isomerase [Roseibium sp. TrichSKD4]
MSAPFLGPDFLLGTPESRRLFHDVAAPLPIVDFHNHLDPEAIASDRSWQSIGEIWLEGDHYKWRAMRWNGIPEERITGDTSFREKFDAFAETIPHCLGNPLHHWTHLELQRYFDWDGILSPETAAEVWDLANALLNAKTHSAQGLLAQMNVEYVGTTDDPCDDLKHHLAAQSDSTLPFKIAPSFRPDKALNPAASGFAEYIKRLSEVSGTNINRFEDLLSALLTRLNFFVSYGCKAADHGLTRLHAFEPRHPMDLDAILQRGQNGKDVPTQDAADFTGALLVELGAAYAERNIVMQFHIGAMRNQNTRLYKALGPDIGGDSMADYALAAELNALLDKINTRKALPRIILYCLNPTLNEVLVTIAGNFQDGSEPGKIQAGPGWWYNDQIDGMERQMTQVAQMGLFSRYIGMLTDSRSFLSFPRHEYYRRLVCRMVGRWVEDGSIPDQPRATDALIRRVCYENARDWFMN